MSETCATARHHATASLLPAKGDLLISRTGCAPCAARSCRKASTFARYCAVEVLHGVGIPAPNSSFEDARPAASKQADTTTGTSRRTLFTTTLCVPEKSAGREPPPYSRLKTTIFWLFGCSNSPS